MLPHCSHELSSQPKKPWLFLVLHLDILQWPAFEHKDSCLGSILLMLPSIALLNLISVFFSSRISVCLFVCSRFSHFGFYFSVKLRFYIIEITFRYFLASHCHSVNCQLSLIVYSYTLLSAWFWQCILILSWGNRFLKVLDACFLYLWTLK